MSNKCLQFAQQIGQSKEKLRRAGPSNIHMSPGDHSDYDELMREGLIAEIQEFLDGLPFPFVRDSPLKPDIEPDFFLDGLVNNIRNEVISHQNFVLKKSKENRTNILKRLSELKSNHTENAEIIVDLEKKLNTLIDAELKHELETNSHFELLNNEQFTPYFIQLSKGAKSEAKLSDIKKLDGSEFSSNTERNEFITNFYAKIYKKPENEQIDLSGCIERFLGPEVCQHPAVTNSKVPLMVSDAYQSNLSLDELDKSAYQANKSACGLDGIQYAPKVLTGPTQNLKKHTGNVFKSLFSMKYM